jgi:large subunit ribosomal protein L10
MPRPEKVQAVADIKERLADAQAVFVAEYSGLSVAEQQKLRRGLKAAGGEFKIVKMTLARRAASELGHDGLLELLVGPTGLAFASGDAAGAAKALRDFAREHDRLVVKGALLGAEVLPPERVSELADIEPREVLLARIAGAFQAPMAAMAGLLAALPRNLATMVGQLIDRAPAEEAEASPVDETAEAAATATAEETPEAGPEDEGDEPGSADEETPADETTDDTADQPDEGLTEVGPDAEADATPDDDDTADQAEEE